MIKSRIYFENLFDCDIIENIYKDYMGFYTEKNFSTGEKYEEYKRFLASKGVKVTATFIF